MRIIIIRPGAIGDTLLTLPAIEKLRQHYEDPDHPIYPQRPHITFVGNAAVLPLLLASGLVDETHDYDERRWSSLFAANGIRNQELREMVRSAERVICLLRDPDGIVMHNLSAAGVHRITIAPGRPEEGKGPHEASYLANVMGVRFFEDERFTLRLNVFPKKTALHERRAFAIHPGSGGAQKCWPPASFADVITRLRRRGTPVTLLSGPADTERLEEIVRLLPSDSKKSLTILDNLPLLEVARHLLSCGRYLGNDSGITHLAAMLGVPTIALFGPSNPGIWHPIGRYVKIIHDPDLAHLSVHSVIERVL
ncbi:MAG TPA: glycosyltransferase family 9 protein [Ktedonobacteraceae bacterium]|nr:glycosyltransferase family 9 protein [Ktedonobacteraceae bacterium]